MRQAVKGLIKTIVPRGLLDFALDVRDAARLAVTSRRQFDASRLRPLSADDLGSIFHSSAAEATWQLDHAAIKEVFGEEDKPGGINPGDRRAVYYLVRALRPQNVLEIGTHIGASTLYLARALKANGNGGKVTSVDILDVNKTNGPWKQAGLTMPPRDLAARLHCEGLVDFNVSPALEFMVASKQRFGLIFLDGDHAAHAVYQEVAAALRVLSPGGVILLHDFYPEGRALFPDDNIIRGPYRAMLCIGREQPAIVVQPLGDLPWQTKQGVHVTSLALLSAKPP